MTGAWRALAILGLLITADCTPVQDTNLQIRADRPMTRAERAERARRHARAVATKPKPPEPTEPGWTRLRCDDGKRFAIRVPRPGGGAEVKVGDSAEVQSFDNLHGQAGNHYGRLPGYSLHQTGRDWTYVEGGAIPPRPVPCRKAG